MINLNKFRTKVGYTDDDEKELKELYEIVQRWIEDGEDKKLALLEHLKNDYYYINDIDCLDIDTDEVAFDESYYLVLTDDEADSKFESYAQSLLDDMLCQVPEYLRNYFNEEDYIDDLKRYEGRGNLLSREDGYEYLYNCTDFDKDYEFDEDIYIYNN